MAKRIITVDDSLTVRQMVKMTLAEAGYEIIEAVDGRDALSKIKYQRIDLVLTDVNMPKMDGIELTRQLRAMPTFTRTPILLLTTESDPGKKFAGRTAGATGWIVKPFSQDQLLTIVARLLSA